MYVRINMYVLQLIRNSAENQYLMFRKSFFSSLLEFELLASLYCKQDVIINFSLASLLQFPCSYPG